MPFRPHPPDRHRVPGTIGGHPDGERKPAPLGQRHPSLHPVTSVRDTPRRSAPHNRDTEDVLEQARQEGFEAGRKAGFEAGREEGFHTGRQEGRAAAEQTLVEHMAQEKAEIEALLSALTNPLKSLTSNVAEAIVEGAQHLAELMVSAHIDSDTHALQAVISEILREEAEIGAGADQRLVIRVSPGRCESVSALAEQRGADIVVDETMGDGDVRVTLTKDTGDPVNKIEWDATLRARWDAIRKALSLDGRR